VALIESRAFADGDLRLLLELEQELWRVDPDDVEHTFGEIAFWSQRLPQSDWEARLWFENWELVGWGWLLRGDELEVQVRPTHRALLDEILDWGRPATTAVQPHAADAIARLRAHGLEHDPSAPWMRCNVRGLDDLPEPSLPAGYRLRTVADGAVLASRSVKREGWNGARWRADRAGRSPRRSTLRASPTSCTTPCARHGRTGRTSTASSRRRTGASRRTRSRGSTR